MMTFRYFMYPEIMGGDRSKNFFNNVYIFVMYLLRLSFTSIVYYY